MAFSRVFVCIASALLVFAQKDSPAHHAFDALLGPEGDEVIEVIEGTVRAFRVMNPHGALLVNTLDESGETQGWLVELNPASQIRREGWSNDMIDPDDTVSVAVLRSRTANRGRLRAVLVHGRPDVQSAQLLVAYGIRGDTSVMRRLRERLQTCGNIDQTYRRTECFVVDDQALLELEAEFPGPMGYVMP